MSMVILLGSVGFGLMYLEGLLVSAVVVNMSHLESRFCKLLAVAIWPMSMPYLAYKTYTKYKSYLSMFSNLQGSLSNPMPDASDTSMDAIDNMQKQFESILAQQETDNSK